MLVQRRDRRRELIRELVATRPVRSQGELVALLADAGVEATQATVSRDLDELGIAKLRGADGQAAYALPETGGLGQLLRQFVRAIDASGNLAVVRTPPGATVQGDDTLLVVAREGRTGSQVAALLAALKNGTAPDSTRADMNGYDEGPDR